MLSSIIIVVICAIGTLAGPISFPPIAPGIAVNTPENLRLIASGNYKQNIEELSGQFEGDIILDPDQYDMIFGNGATRNGLINRQYRWPDNTVPYVLDQVNHTKVQADHIEKAFRHIESISCLKFVRRTDENDYVQLTGANAGCWSYVGRQGGEQLLNLQPFEPETGCFRLGTIVHEAFHALGFYHMQSSSERDEHVKVEWDHLIAGTEFNFNKYNTSLITNFDHGYDYDSIMHYGAYGFTKDGYATLVPNNIAYINVIGQRGQLSQGDIAKVNTMYECD